MWSPISTCHREVTISSSTKPPRRPARRADLRADARENRERILAAAREVYAEQGLEAPLAEVARRAGVGVATLFRRFPDREQLITAVFATKITAYADAIDAALADPDPWQGFQGLVRRVAAMQAEDRGFTRVMTRNFPSSRLFEAERRRGYELLKELIVRAKATGKLRPDFEPQDFGLVMMANAGVVNSLGEELPTASPRLIDYLLQSFASEAALAPLPPAPSEAEVRRAKERAARR